MKALKFTKGMLASNEDIKKRIYESQITKKRMITKGIIDLIRSNALSDEIITEILKLLTEIIFEAKVEINESNKLILKYGYFFGIELTVLNELYWHSEEWKIKVKRIIRGLIKIIEGSCINYLTISNVKSNLKVAKYISPTYKTNEKI